MSHMWQTHNHKVNQLDNAKDPYGLIENWHLYWILKGHRNNETEKQEYQ